MDKIAQQSNATDNRAAGGTAGRCARVLAMMPNKTRKYRLTDALLLDVDAAMADADAGIRTDKEIDAILNRSWT